MEGFVFLVMLAAVIALAAGLYRISSHAIEALRIHRVQGIEAQLERVADQLARVANGQETLLQALADRASRLEAASANL